MSQRKFKPGNRERRFHEARYSDERFAWLQTYIGQFVLMFYENEIDIPEEERKDKLEPGPTLRLMLPQLRGKSMLYNVTALTHEELVEMKKIFDMLFQIAEPIVKERDKAAQDAFDRGDDSIRRIYRQAPHMVVREGPLGKYSASVLKRLASAPDGVELDGDLQDQIRRDIELMVEQEQKDSLAEHNGEEANEH